MADLEKQTEELAALTRVKKNRVAMMLQADEDVPAAELKAISDLELRVANMEALVRARELTREPA